MSKRQSTARHCARPAMRGGLGALGRRPRQRPALLQAPEAPHRERHGPRRHEERDDDVAHRVEVDPDTQSQKPPRRLSWSAAIESSSMVPMMSATATERAVIVRL